MGSLKDKLRAASAMYETPESLAALVEELASMTVTLSRSRPEAITLLRAAAQILSEANDPDGKMWILAKATVGERESRVEGMPIADSLAGSLAAVAALAPELPRLVADTEGALEALTRAAEALEAGAQNAQQLWLPHVHEAFVALGFVTTKGGQHGRSEDAYGATRKRLERHGKTRVDKRGDVDHRRLLLLLSEPEY